MRLRLIVLLAALSVMFGCGQKTATDGLPVLDLETAIESPRTFDLSGIAQNIEFIPLDDNNREGLVGVIENIEESETGFYIHDDWERPVKVFDKTGKFLYTRGIFGRGPNEVWEIANLAVDYKTDNLYLNGGEIAYSIDGRVFARNDSVRPASQIKYLNGTLFASRGGYDYYDRDPSRKVTFITLYSPNLTLQSTIDVWDKGPHITMIDMGDGRRAFVNFVSDILSDNGNSLLAKEGRSDTVFRYTGENSLLPTYYLEMGNHAIPNEVMDGTAGLDIGDGRYAIINIFEADRYVFIIAQEFGISDHVCLIFSISDLSGGFMAMGSDGENGLFIDGVKFSPCYVRDNQLVGYMQAIDIVDNADAITNPELKALAATLREDSNPVIVVATLKK